MKLRRRTFLVSSLLVTALLPAAPVAGQTQEPQRLSVVGGTYRGETQTLASGTAILLVLDARTPSPAMVTITGPSGWNNGRPWTFGVEGSWRWDVLLTARTIAGPYAVELSF